MQYLWKGMTIWEALKRLLYHFLSSGFVGVISVLLDLDHLPKVFKRTDICKRSNTLIENETVVKFCLGNQDKCVQNLNELKL